MTEAAMEKPVRSTPNVSTLHTRLGLTNPSLAADVFRSHVSPDTKALVIRGWSTGTVHENLLPLIKETIDKGVSVFVLSDNPMDTHGIRTVKYQTHEDAIQAGAVLLRDVNTNQAEEVFSAIQDEIDQGKVGKELDSAIAAKFGTPNDPQK